MTISYERLDPNLREIRILTLVASSAPQDQIECKLSKASLTALHVLPPYVALSYTWGDATKRAAITVDGQLYLATDNLKVALQHLRDSRNDIYLWIDAICINQDDNDEVDRQLQIVHKIFSQAKETWAWLGQEEDESSRAIDLIERLSAHAKSAAILEDAAETEAIEPHLRSKDIDLWKEASNLVALQDLLLRPYWYRVWIVQEISVSQEIVVCCGQRKFSWGALNDMVEFCIQRAEIRNIIHHYLRCTPGFGYKLQRLYSGRWIHDGFQRVLTIQSVRNDILHPDDFEERPRDTLLYILSSHRSTEATEANDKYLRSLA